jgi:transaldolase
MHHAIHNADESMDITTLAETLTSMITNEKIAEKIFSEAKEKEKKATEEYETAIYNNDVANEKYSDAVNKMEIAWKLAQDSVQLV